MTQEEKKELKIKSSMAALTGLLSNPNVVKQLDEDIDFISDIAMAASLYADTLIDQLEEEEEYRHVN